RSDATKYRPARRRPTSDDARNHEAASGPAGEPRPDLSALVAARCPGAQTRAYDSPVAGTVRALTARSDRPKRGGLRRINRPMWHFCKLVSKRAIMTCDRTKARISPPCSHKRWKRYLPAGASDSSALPGRAVPVPTGCPLLSTGTVLNLGELSLL